MYSEAGVDLFQSYRYHLTAQELEKVRANHKNEEDKYALAQADAQRKLEEACRDQA